MTDFFDYRPEIGYALRWDLEVSGISDVDDGPLGHDGIDSLCDLEGTIEDAVEDYAAEHVSDMTRVYGAHGWRVYEWDNGSVIRFQWTHTLVEFRCPVCKTDNPHLYMVTDALWAISGLDGVACFRCLEKAIGCQLEPADFEPGLTCNTAEVVRDPELWVRLGFT